jgi:hypothetical protein
VLGFSVTFGLLAVLVGWLPVSPAVRTLADDAATPLMLMGWVMALLAALQIFRGRRGAA